MTNFTKLIIDHSFEYAKDLLADTGQCYPFAAFIDRGGIVHPLEFEIEDKKNMPNNEIVISGLTKYCETEFKAGRIRAFGLTYEANVQLEIDADGIETIAMDIVDSKDKEIPMYYFPYEFDSNKNVVFGETFAVRR